MTTLKPGDKAPAFSGKDQDDKNINLKNYAGKKLILYFYPKDNTPGCTNESCNLRDNYEMMMKQGFEVLGVSADTAASHRKFIDKHELPFALIADTEKVVIEKYGVWGLKKFMGREYMGLLRTTFVIDEKGIIEEVFTKVKTKEHTSQIMEALEG